MFFGGLVRINLFLFQKLAGHEIGIAAEQNVRAATRHVRGDRDRAFTAGLRDDLGFTFVMLRVEHVVRYAHAHQAARDQFRVFHRNRAHQHRLALFVTLLDLFDDGVPLLRQRAIDHVGIVPAHHRHVRRNHDNFQFVSRMKLAGFGFRGAGHARKLLVEPKIILQRDRRQRLVLALDLYLFLRFDGLMQSVRPTPPFHQTSGEVIDDDHLAVLHDVLMIQTVKRVGFQCLLDTVQQLHVRRIVKIADAEQLFRFVHAIFGQHRGMVLLVDDVIAGLLAFGQFFAALKLRNDRVRLIVLVR